MPLEGETAYHGGDVGELCVLLAKSLRSGKFFVKAIMHLDIKLLTACLLLMLMSVNFLTSFFGDW